MGCGGSKGVAVIETRPEEIIKPKGTLNSSQQPQKRDIPRRNINDNHETIDGESEKDTSNVVLTRTDESALHIEHEVDESAVRKPNRTFTESPFDPSVDVGQNPIPVFGRDAFPLSAGQPELTVEDTFWPGKREMIPDYARMRALDQHAIEAPARLRKNMDQLLGYLTKPAKTDLERFRVLFRWTAHNIRYDVVNFNAGTRGDNSAEGVLSSGLAVCAGYSNLIFKMCQIAGVQCEKLSGHSKGAGYKPGMADLTKVSHAWNSVTLDGRKFFADCTWAAGSVDKDGFSRHWKEHEFLAEPQGFTERHLTKDLTNQDCPSPYDSVDQWNNEPHLGISASFAGLECLSHKEGIILAPDNEVLIRFRLKRVLYRSFCVVKDKNGTKSTNVVHHWWTGNELSCRVTLPKAGKYEFMLLGHFTLASREENKAEVLFPNSADEVTENTLVSYTINATGHQSPKPLSVSENVTLFGAPLNLPEAGLIPATTNQAVIEASKGTASVVFKKIGQGPSKMQVEFHSFEDKAKSLASSIYCEQFGDWIVCHVRCPSHGLFELNMFVTGRENGLTCFLKYTLKSEGKITAFEFPTIHGLAGPLPPSHEMGLILADSLSSTIVTEGGDGNLAFRWETSKMLEIHADLKDASGSKSLKEDGNLIVETCPGTRMSTTEISLRIKKKGVYKLLIFAKDSSMSSSVYVGSWLVVCWKSSDNELYPLRASVLGSKEEFRSMGLEISIHSRISCKNGEGVIEVRSKSESMTEFLCQLSRSGENEAKGQVFADTTSKGEQKTTRFYLRIKKTGMYAFRLFANQHGNSGNTYVGVWLVDCRTGSSGPPFPGKHICYGPNKCFRDRGLQVDERASKKLELKSGEGELYITHEPGTNRRISVCLENEAGQSKKSKQCTLIESRWTATGDLSTSRIRIRTNVAGLFDLIVFAEKDSGSGFDYAGVWLIECVTATSKPLFPESHGSMGPDKGFFKMGLSLVEPLCSTVSASDGGVCRLTIQRNTAFETIFSGSKADLDISKDVSRNGKHVVTCSVRLHHRGAYILKMFLSEPSGSSKDYRGNWLLEWT